VSTELSACRCNLAKGGLICNISCILVSFYESMVGTIYGYILLERMVYTSGLRDSGLVLIMVHIIPDLCIMIITNMIPTSLYSMSDGLGGVY